MRKTYRNKSRKRNGGGATVMPLSYYHSGAQLPDAAAGHDLLRAIPPIGVRPKIGGRRRRTKKHTRRHYKKKGGFVPSVMDGFVAAASKYVVPVALFAGYKLMTRKQKRSGRYTKRR